MKAPTAEEQLPPLTISFSAQGDPWIALSKAGTIQAAPERVARYVPEAKLLAAEAKLRAISDALTSGEKDHCVMLARIRAIVEGKDSVPSSPQPPR